MPLTYVGHINVGRMGLVVQASHVGQMAGPPLVAALAASSGGWSVSPIVLVPAACVVLGAALLLKRSH